jgi:hypothetical protein
MGLLDQLRADTGGTPQNNEKWSALPTLLSDRIPAYQHGKTVLVRGEVILIGNAKNFSGSRHFYAVLHSERTAMDPAASKNFTHHEKLGGPRPPQARPIAMGVSRYRADSQANYFSFPWVAWIQNDPTAMAAWISMIITTTTEDTPHQERLYREKRR